METLIRKEHFREMPWKNGLGVTQEIDIFPSHSDFTKGDFHWRLSSAVVKMANTFSQFPGYDRLLMVLSGDGLKLNQKNLEPLSVHAFSGDEKIDCALIGGPVVDIGIIFKRDLYRCEMQIVTVTQDSKLFFGDGVHYIKSLDDKIQINGAVISGEEILKIEGSEIVEIEIASQPKRFLKISLFLK